MYIAGIKYILGLNIEHGYLKIEPHIPANWDGYIIKYRYGNSMYNIKVINKQNNVKGINERTKIKCNGEEIIDGKIKLEKSGKIYNIEAFI